MIVLAAALVGLFLVELLLSRSLGITLYPYYWIPVVLAASFATPRQVGWFTSLAIVLTVVWSLQSPQATTLKLLLRLAGLIGIAWVSMHLARELQAKDRSNRELKDHYQLLAENAPDVVLSSDCQGRISWVSPAVQQLLGHDARALRDRTIAELVLEPDRDRLDQAIDRVLQGENSGCDLRFRAADGGSRWISMALRPVPGPDGDVTGLVGSWRDIQGVVDARLAEERTKAALAASEERLRLTMENTSTGIALLDAEGHVLSINPAAGGLLDRDPADLEGLTWPSCSPPEDRAGEAPLMAELVDGRRRCYRLRKRILQGERPPLWVDCSVSSSRRPDGSLAFVIAQFNDVTEMVQAEAALASSEQRYRLLAENSSDVVLLVKGGLVSWISPSLTCMLGWQPEDWVGHPLSHFIPADDHPLLDQDLQTLAGGGTVVRRLQALAHDRSRRWVELHASPHRDPLGQLDGIVGSFRTVDQEVAAERELARRACTDELTGLVNRHEARERITAIAGRVQRQGDATAVLFCDLDNFKEINDTFGHGPGDELLRTVAARIRSGLRSGDMAARIGGDELVVVLQGVRGLGDAVTIAEKLRRAVAEPILTSAGSLSITLSIGVTMVRPGENPDAIITRADHAMYRAKQTGRNQVVPFSEQTDSADGRSGTWQPAL
ncbi:PAS domain S-box protein [Synechococcus sp. BA-124 BA4]|uniref:sensor domain-containing protein n=1 Tax=Synechococcus sp. BA-124 BA4 TaxID=3110251 RepID=UPI002B201A1C|nr:PAS domain S-box protein [Synechococcus sp. BA-124 BA4]MEA5400911.1 PAS domain S-box protein [Synechococcus sp. BA-124 BA4]